MIISPGRGYIFVHVPKTGGTSVALALEARAMKDDILIGDTPKARRRRDRVAKLKAHRRLWKHSRLSDLDGLLAPEQIHAMRVVTIVRNPWDRMVSYYHWLQTQTFDHPAVTLAQTCDFSRFLNADLTQRTFQASPYSHYMTDGAGQVHADLYIRLEHFEDDVAPLAAHLGFTPQLPHANASDRARDWRSFYTEADAKRLADICAPDIAAHGYAFDPA